MADRFAFWSKEFPEAYEIVRTVDLVHSRKTYRVEVVRIRSKSTHKYTVQYWKNTEINAKPALPEDKLPGEASRRIEVWRRTDFPDVHEDDPDTALDEAMRWIANKA